jgi:hypothetical protein
MTMHEFQKCKKMMNQETFLTQRVLKAEEKLKKQRKENREQEMTILMYHCLNEGRVVHNNISTVDLSYLTWLIDHNLKDIGRRLAATVPLPPPVASKSEEMAIMGHGHVGIPINDDDILQSQLLMDSMVAGNVQETVPFGEINSGVCPDLLP